MGNHFGYTISGPQLDATDLPIRQPKSPLLRRDQNHSDQNLRSLYQKPAAASNPPTSRPSHENALNPPATPVLPPTPPNIEDESDGHPEEAMSASETARARSMLTTPINQMSPPTPDNTPPRDKSRLRPFLGAQPSMASTRAESFKTALEDIQSDRESVASMPPSSPQTGHTSPLLPPLLPNGVYKPSPLANVPITSLDISSEDSLSPIPISARISRENRLDLPTPTIDPNISHLPLAEASLIHAPALSSATSPVLATEVPGSEPTIKSRKESVRHNVSLRKRLEDSHQIPHSSSVDKFANIIGWNDRVQSLEINRRRWSGTSNTSTVEAFLIEPPSIPKKRNTLRHVSKNESLRSASSPLPNSNRNSMQSSSDSPHRLIHKKAKLSYHNRLSFGSEMSQPVSMTSIPPPKPEIIRVAVIPERSSSLQPSVPSSRRHSHSNVGAPSSFHMRNTSDVPRKKKASPDASDRGRERYYPPQVPPRGSSRSASTSRNTSRANSIVSENFHFERRRDEADLMMTPDQIEMEKLEPHLKTASVDAKDNSPEVEFGRLGARGPALMMPPDPFLENAIPGTQEWADLRPTSTLHTPFSQPSLMSASPEISEARMISLHLHNNHSVQLIEPSPLQESHAALEAARKLNRTDFTQPIDVTSPLRNPRRPPAPPQVRFIPPMPQDEIEASLVLDEYQAAQSMTAPRPVNRARTDSFKALLRNVSLKNARNKKADQDLDSTLNPFWRPRPFWEGIEGASPEKKRDAGTKERGIVNNSLGLPQQRLIVTGPLELVRKLSERRRNRRIIAKRPSHSSLQRLRAGRKIYRLPSLGLHLHMISLKDVQDRIVTTRQRREDEKRERRREALRKSIGPNVIATGDSRFLSSMYTASNQQ